MCCIGQCAVLSMLCGIGHCEVLRVCGIGQYVDKVYWAVCALMGSERIGQCWANCAISSGVDTTKVSNLISSDVIISF